MTVLFVRMMYDKYIVAFSGGKDSIACFLHLLESGVPAEKIELWHHLIDGDGEVFMDWEITEDYCRKFAAAFSVPIYFSWRVGGFIGEMMRQDAPTGAVVFEDGNGQRQTVGGQSNSLGTRLRFPQVSPDLRVRWCSSYLKIMVMGMAIRNQARFNSIRTLVISGERGEESPARAKYAVFGPHETHLAAPAQSIGLFPADAPPLSKRHVDRWRPIRDWKEAEVWAIIQRWGVRPHPAYELGWGRVSCKFCIFGNANQFASAAVASPEIAEKIAGLETGFGCTIKRKGTIRELIAKGQAYAMSSQGIALATSFTYSEAIRISPADWKLPPGAFGDGCGPV